MSNDLQISGKSTFKLKQQLTLVPYFYLKMVKKDQAAKGLAAPEDTKKVP